MKKSGNDRGEKENKNKGKMKKNSLQKRKQKTEKHFWKISRAGSLDEITKY